MEARSQTRTCYDLLQVQPGAGPEDIKRAFYRLAKRFHPDVSRSSARFLKILDAYKTLMDDNKRERCEAVGERTRTFLSRERVSYALSLQDVLSPGEGVFRRETPLYRGGTGRPVESFRRKGRKGSFVNPKGYDVSIRLTRDELEKGAVALVDLPARVICPLCRGNRVRCSFCSDRGSVLRAVSVPVPLPPPGRRADFPDGAVFSFPLREMKRREYAFFTMKELLVQIRIVDG